MDFVFVPIICLFVRVMRIVTILTRPISEWTLNIFYIITVGKTKRLPPITDPVLLMSAKEVAEKIRKRQLSSEKVMTIYIQRCKEVNPLINAAVDERYEAAMEEAIAIDQMLAEGEKTEFELAIEKPLLGVPFSCKEAIGVKDLSQTCGILCARDRKAPEDSAVAALYRASGAIPIVVTNVPQMCMWWDTANILYGRTKNPYDNHRTVGGSSGGEAAIITACGTQIGIGNDIAGSVRIPASFCGIYGHKPSTDLVSNKGSWPDDNEDFGKFICTGPMCRYVEDLPMLTRILAGENRKKVPFDATVDFRKVKIFYMEEFPGWTLSASNDVKFAVRKAAEHFKDKFGIRITQIDLPELYYAFNMWDCKLLERGIPPVKDYLTPGGNISLTWEFFKSIFRNSEHTWPILYFAATDRRSKDKFYHKCLEEYDKLKKKLEEYLEGDAILLIPTYPDPPPHYLMTIPMCPKTAYTCVFNILGYPSTQIPAGMSQNLPIGIQAISTQYKDHLTLAVATELDKVFGGWRSPCPIKLKAN